MNKSELSSKKKMANRMVSVSCHIFIHMVQVVQPNFKILVMEVNLIIKLTNENVDFKKIGEELSYFIEPRGTP